MSPEIKIEKVELVAGKNYSLALPSGVVEFSAEAGGIMSGKDINGSVQDGKVIFTAGEDEYEGYFKNKTTIEATRKDDKGQVSKVDIVMTAK